MHPCTGNWLVVYYTRAAHAFSAGIKSWHCILIKAIDTDLVLGLFSLTGFMTSFSARTALYKIALNPKFDVFALFHNL